MSDLADPKAGADISMPIEPPSRYKRALPIVAVYAAVATLWILFSDAVLASLFSDRNLLVQWSTFKGLAFVAVTSALLWVMVLKTLATIERSFAALASKDAQLRLSEAQVSAIVETATDAILSFDADHRIVFLNTAAQRLFQCEKETARGELITRYLPELPAVTKQNSLSLVGRRSDGTAVPIEASLSCTDAPGGPATTIILRDITQRLAQQVEFERLQRLHEARSQINRSIVWAVDRDQLLDRICIALTEHGGFRLAWIARHDADTNILMPVAKAGDDLGYLDNLRISTQTEPGMRGPSATSFLTALPYVCNDIQAEPTILPWRQAAIQSGLRSMAVFPIMGPSGPRGTLNVYATEADYFKEPELRLLTESAGDIAYALSALELDQEKELAQAQARRERQFSESMIDSLPGILYFYDSAGQFLRWNRNFEIISGYSAEEISRMHPIDFFAGPDKALVQSRIESVFSHGEAFVEANFTAKDGRTTQHYFTGKRIELDGRACLVGVGIDISDRLRAEKKLRDSEERYRQTLDRIIESCQLFAFDWTYLYLNEAAEKNNRRPNSEVLGRTIFDAWPGIEHTEVFALFESCMKSRQSNRQEISFGFPDGLRGWFDVTVHPAPEGIYVLSVEITERKQAELALRELNENLEQKIVERTTALHAALERAEAADRIKSAFLATMSHELRTPLNSIIGFTGIVLQGLAGPLNDEQNKQLTMVRGSARHLLDLINDVLDLSKIEAGQLEVRKEVFDARAAIERAVGSVRLHAKSKGLELTTTIADDIGEMIGDRRRMEQILLNILNNAIKFTDHGHVKLNADIRGDASAGRELQVTISDTGIGIKTDDVEKLFQPFHQIDSGLTRQHEGTGLGLAICRRLAGLMGGEVTAVSQWQKGSEFTLTLPIDGK